MVQARAGRAAGTTALALAVAFATTVGTPDAALAARSGGRMGGGSFRASSMSSFRAPRASSLGTSSYSAPSVGAPITRTSSFMVGPGFGYGFGMGPGLYFGGGGFFNFIFFAMMMLFVSNALQNLTGGGGFGDGLTAGGDSISVVKIQVGLLGTARSLQRDLERIADKADTSSPEGLHYVLEETALALLRNRNTASTDTPRPRCAEAPNRRKKPLTISPSTSVESLNKRRSSTSTRVKIRRRRRRPGRRHQRLHPRHHPRRRRRRSQNARHHRRHRSQDGPQASRRRSRRGFTSRRGALDPQEEGRRPHPNRALTRLPHPRQSLAATFALRDARVVKNHPTVTLTSIVRVRSITAPLSAPSRARAGTPARIFHESNGHFPTSHH